MAMNSKGLLALCCVSPCSPWRLHKGFSQWLSVRIGFSCLVMIKMLTPGPFSSLCLFLHSAPVTAAFLVPLQAGSPNPTEAQASTVPAGSETEHCSSLKFFHLRFCCLKYFFYEPLLNLIEENKHLSASEPSSTYVLCFPLLSSRCWYVKIKMDRTGCSQGSLSADALISCVFSG